MSHQLPLPSHEKKDELLWMEALQGQPHLSPHLHEILFHQIYDTGPYTSQRTTLIKYS